MEGDLESETENAKSDARDPTLAWSLHPQIHLRTLSYIHTYKYMLRYLYIREITHQKTRSPQGGWEVEGFFEWCRKTVGQEQDDAFFLGTTSSSKCLLESGFLLSIDGVRGSQKVKPNGRKLETPPYAMRRTYSTLSFIILNCIQTNIQNCLLFKSELVKNAFNFNQG